MNEDDVINPAGLLELFGIGLMSKRQAVESLGLRDYAYLLIALGAAGLA